MFIMRDVLSKMGWVVVFVFALSSHAFATEGLRGQRYCDVIYWHGLSGFVYNTLHLNDCPSTLWSKLTPSLVKNVTGSHFVYLNGPRHYVLDDVKNASAPSSEIKVFGGIAMRQTATVRIRLKDIFIGAAPYREHPVKHHLICVYHSGKPVYELIDPKGHVYVMQSYTSEVTKLNEASLASLDKQLRLPKGWSFRTGVLTSDKTLVVKHNEAMILLDNFKNVYQRVPKDLLS